jgi:hypothetical protein
LVELLICNQQVGGSSPSDGSKFKFFNMGKLNLNSVPLDDDESPKGRYQKQENKKPKLTDKSKKNKGKGK